MKNADRWVPGKFEFRRGAGAVLGAGGVLRGSRDVRELGVGSRLISDLVAGLYQRHLSGHAQGRLLDLGCGKVPLYAAYAALVAEVTCVDWAPGEHIDLPCDLSQPLPFVDSRFDTLILSDVLEHMPEPDALWREMTRVLAPGGKVLLNVPFYYSVHAHPHDYYRYTNFALERFVALNGLRLLHIEAVGGLVEILADLSAKAFSKLPVLGPPLAMLTQWAALRFHRTALGTRVARVSSRHFPLGYFLVAQKPPASDPP